MKPKTPYQNIYIGTAGWNLPADFQNFFPKQGSHLERYAQKLNSVEINSSFYKEHEYKTYLRWSESVPEDFRFSVKLSRFFTQETKLCETERLSEVLEGISGLGHKWSVLLVQLPPSLDFEAESAEVFMLSLTQKLKDVSVVWEPRHPSWTNGEALKLLSKYKISKVIADPEPCVLTEAKQAKVEFIRYVRLHGSPQIYKSRYDQRFLNRIKSQINQSINFKPIWCIFDNTTYGFAAKNALELQDLLGKSKENIPLQLRNIGT